MARYNHIQIGTIHLTNDGTAIGMECKTSVIGLNFLKTSKAGNIQYSADGTPYAQIIDVGNKGVALEIGADWMSKTVFDSIVALMNTALNTFATINIIITGDTGDFSVNCIPNIPDIVSWDSFISGTIKGVKFRFVTT